MKYKALLCDTSLALARRRRAPVGGPDVIERVDAPREQRDGRIVAQTRHGEGGAAGGDLGRVGVSVDDHEMDRTASAPSSCDASCISAPSTGQMSLQMAS